MDLPHRILLLCREGSQLCYDPLRWEYVWRWHTWTVEDSLWDALAEAARLRVGLNPMVKSVRIIPKDEPYWV